MFKNLKVRVPSGPAWPYLILLITHSSLKSQGIIPQVHHATVERAQKPRDTSEPTNIYSCEPGPGLTQKLKPVK